MGLVLSGPCRRPLRVARDLEHRGPAPAVAAPGAGLAACPRRGGCVLVVRTRTRMRSARPRVAVVAAVVVLIALVSALAWAEHADYKDGNDTVSVLDVHVVKFNQPKGEAPAWTVITFATWKVGQLW